MDQVTYNDQQDNDHRGDWDWDDKQRKDDDGFNNEELMMITIQESLPLLNFGSNQHPLVALIQNFFVKFLLARIPPHHYFQRWVWPGPWNCPGGVPTLFYHW